MKILVEATSAGELPFFELTDLMNGLFEVPGQETFTELAPIHPHLVTKTPKEALVSRSFNSMLVFNKFVLRQVGDDLQTHIQC